MNQSSLEFAICKLMDLGGGNAAGSGSESTGDIRLEMLNFVRKKNPDIGGENIILAIHIGRDGEKPAGDSAGTPNGTNTSAGAAVGKASAAPARGKIMEE